MLPAASRLTTRDEFTAVLRHGRSSGRSRLVVHVNRVPEQRAPRAGFVVSKAVGGSVVRHRVVRRLRHLVGPRLPGLGSDIAMVVRALPAASGATSAELAGDLDAGLRGALHKLDRAGRRGCPRPDPLRPGHAGSSR